MKCFLLALVLLLSHQNVTFAVNLQEPYFLILEAEPSGQNSLIQTTDTCPSGGYSNVGITLKKFCATGFWILISEWCGDENGQKYFIAARDSCFKVPDTEEIKIKRFMPILQQLSDFDGYAYGWRDEATAYFIRFNDKSKTILKPMDGLNKHWEIMTVNQKFYQRYLHEISPTDQNNSRQCYSAQDHNEVFQFYRMASGRDHPVDSTFEPYNEQGACKPGFNVVSRDHDTMTGVMYWNLGSTMAMLNSTSSFMHMRIRGSDFVKPANEGKQVGQCSDDKRALNKGYKTLGGEGDQTAPEDTYPKFPHQLPQSDANQLMTDEIQETSLKFLEFQLHNTPIPKINKSEYVLLQQSSAILEKFCCDPAVNRKALFSLRLLFRLSLLYYQDSFPYPEQKNEEEENRISKALMDCAARTDATPSCITIHRTTSCPETINYTMWNSTVYHYGMPEDVEYEEGNMDYVLETAWKSMLFVHYYCSSFFLQPTDHSSYAVKIESFFNPVMKLKWNRPRNAHRIYKMLLNDVNLKKFGEAVDVCVDTAQQTSKYVRWLSRPDVDEISRRKRQVDGSTSGECVPKSQPKVYCLEKQFDMIDHNLVHPKPSSGECYNSYQNRAKYKYMHASTYDTTY